MPTDEPQPEPLSPATVREWMERYPSGRQNLLGQALLDVREQLRLAQADNAALFVRLEKIEDAWIEQESRPYDIGNLIGEALNQRKGSPGTALLAELEIL